MRPTFFTIKLFLTLGLLMLVGISCTTTNVTSKLMDEEHKLEVDNIFYAIYFDKGLIKTVPSLVKRSEEIYSKNMVRFDYVQFDFFSDQSGFNLDSLSKEAQEKKFDFLLIVKEVSIDSEITSTPMYYSGGTFYGGGATKRIEHGLEAFLFNSDTKKEIWRAQIEVASGSYGNSNQSGKSLGVGIIKQLKEDDLLPASFPVVTWNQ